jgi:hypothetical protein
MAAKDEQIDALTKQVGMLSDWLHVACVLPTFSPSSST